jgi:hypothetical protein
VNHQLIRARGFLSTAIELAEVVEDDLKGPDELSVEAHGLMVSRLFGIETSAKMARELVTDSMKRKLTESKVMEKGAST